MPKKPVRRVHDVNPFEMALSMLERMGRLTIPELERLAALVASRQEPGAISGVVVLGRTAAVDDVLVAAPSTTDDAARATLKGLEMVRAVAKHKVKGTLTRGLRTAVLAQVEAIRTAAVKW